jgi:excisionase family DNA binding protein
MEPNGTALNLDRLWTARDVADYLQASRSWVYQKAESGTLPHLRIGGLLRFDPEVVRAFARGNPPASGAVVALTHKAGRR